jgi:hypothetical protein
MTTASIATTLVLAVLGFQDLVAQEAPTLVVECSGGAVNVPSLPAFDCEWTADNADYVLILGYLTEPQSPAGSVTFSDERLSDDGPYTFVAVGPGGESAKPVARVIGWENIGGAQALHFFASVNLSNVDVAGDFSETLTTDHDLDSVTAAARTVLQNWGYLIEEHGQAFPLPGRERAAPSGKRVALSTDGFVFHEALCFHEGGDCDRPPEGRRRLLKVSFVVWITMVEKGAHIAVTANLISTYRRQGTPFKEVEDVTLRNSISRVLVDSLRAELGIPR